MSGLEDVFPFKNTDGNPDKLFVHEHSDSASDVFDYFQSPETLDGPSDLDDIASPKYDDETSLNNEGTSQTPGEELRRSTRSTRAPLWQKDYVMTGNSVVHLIDNQVCYNSIHPNYKTYISALDNNTEPDYYVDAAKDKNWVETMKAEIKVLEENKTWTLVPLLPRKYVIGGKWVYKIKHNSNGSIESNKACLVAKGFIQKKGIYYNDIFYPIAKMVNARPLLVIVVMSNQPLYQMDVFNAYLQGDLNEKIFMQIPYDFRKQEESDLVCRLRKSLYGLKQASRQQNIKLVEALKKNGYKRSMYDYSLFTKKKKKQGSRIVALLIYVDDLVITGNKSLLFFGG